MKRFSFCDSSGNLIYPPEEKENLVYSGEFQAMLDGLDDDESIEENVGMNNGKKRRLSVDQVHSLEKVFEVDNKLDPERKVKIATELGLQPRQVAIWFQNRRARCKTKQLERDYNILKANYETMKLNYIQVEQEKEGLIAELKGLKEKLVETNKKQSSPENQDPAPINCGVHSGKLQTKDLMDLKDGSSDSDSSGVLNNEDYCSFNNCPPLMLAKSSVYQPQFVKMAEQVGGFNVEESCNIFSLDQAPNLFWY